jgi:glutamate/aspartate transport system permease protein
MYTFAAAVYFVISFSLSYIVKRLQAKVAVIR